MSDTRFIILGVGLIFVGIIVLTVFGAQVDEITLQEEFRECYEYHTDAPPTEIDCDIAFQNKMIIFAIVALLITCGIASLVKGIRGGWDQNVKPEDMVGPNRTFDTRDGPNDSDQNDTK
ncbi:MAG TPA: hypothetical protein EYG64_04495 [Candidatus Nitrosopelagicus sp.]|nr:hypothetical protein [Candidatus Nitrosopelagicus sp.]